MRKPRCRVFTLIEMLVVVAIIAILASLLAPSLQRAVQRAKGAACMGGPVKNIGFMIGLYANDFNDMLPGDCSDNNGKGAKWYLAFWNAGYLKNGLEMWCPSVTFMRDYNWGHDDFYKYKGEIDRQAYGCMATAVYTGRDTTHQYGGFYKFGQLKRPGKQIFAGDAAWNLREPLGAARSGYFVIHPNATEIGPESNVSNGFQGRVEARHANCAALVNFGGNAEMFQFFDRLQPWLNAPFGQNSSIEYKMRCTNSSY